MGILLGGDHEGALKVDLQMFDRARSFRTKYTNMVKFMSSHLSSLGFAFDKGNSQVNFYFEMKQVKCSDFPLVELSFLLEMQEITERVVELFQNYRIHRVASMLESHLFDNLCSKYLEFAKMSLKSTKTSLERVKKVLACNV